MKGELSVLICAQYMYLFNACKCVKEGILYLLYVPKSTHIMQTLLHTFMHVCVRFPAPPNHKREKERNKHWILTGCHPPLLLFSEGSRLPNP